MSDDRPLPLNTLATRPYCNWADLGQIPPFEMGSRGRQGSDAPWYKRFYAWLYARQSAEAKTKWGPPATGDQPEPPSTPQGVRLMPVLLAPKNPNNSPAMGFVEVSDSAPIHPIGGDDGRTAANGALRYIQSRTNQAKALNAKLHWRQDAVGDSVGLSAFIAAMCAGFGLKLPDTVAATGTWIKDEFKGVNKNTLLKKIEIAKAWVNRTLFIVDDKEFPEGCIATGIDIRRVPAKPFQAMVELMRFFHADTDKFLQVFGFSERVAELSRGVLGREEHLVTIRNFIDHSSSGEIMWIHGVSLIGKSAVMAKLAIELVSQTSVCVCTGFFDRSNGVLAEFLKSSTQRIETFFSLEVFEEGDNAARFAGAIADASNLKNGNILFLVDGLDELSQSDFVEFVKVFSKIRLANRKFPWVLQV